MGVSKNIGQRDVVADKMIARANSAIERSKDLADFRKRSIDCRAIRLPVVPPREHILQNIVANHCRIPVAIENADPLFGLGAFCWRLRHQSGPRQGLVQMAHDRARFVQRQFATAIGRHFAERVQSENFRRLWRMRLEGAGDALFGERHARRANIRRTIVPEDGWRRRCRLALAFEHRAEPGKARVPAVGVPVARIVSEEA